MNIAFYFITSKGCIFGYCRPEVLTKKFCGLNFVLILIFKECTSRSRDTVERTPKQFT